MSHRQALHKTKFLEKKCKVNLCSVNQISFGFFLKAFYFSIQLHIFSASAWTAFILLSIYQIHVAKFDKQEKVI